MVFNFFLPKVNFFFGQGALKHVGEETKKLGNHALLITGKKSMARLGIVEEAKEYLYKAGLEVTHFDKVIPNPTSEIVDEGAKIAISEKCDLLIGLGGGSSIDAAKAIAIVAGHSADEFHSIWEFSPSEDIPFPITRKTLPVLTITSTSGTGSHVSKFAVITNPQKKEKVGISSEYIFPKVSIVDIDILKNMPPSLTAECGVDVLAHSLEGLISRESNLLSEEFALKSIQLVFDNLLEAYRDGDNLRSREGMALADTYAGFVLTTSRVVLPHALSHPVSAYYPDVSHGTALAALTPVCMEFIIERADEETLRKFSFAGGAMGEKIYGISRNEAMKSVEAIRNLLSKINMDRGLVDLGVDKKNIPQMVESAIKTGKRPLELNPTEVDKKDILRLFRSSLYPVRKPRSEERG